MCEPRKRVELLIISLSESTSFQNISYNRPSFLAFYYYAMYNNRSNFRIRYDFASDPFRYPFHEILHDFLDDCHWSRNIKWRVLDGESNGSGQHLSTLRIGRIPLLSSPLFVRNAAQRRNYLRRGRSGRRRVKQERLESHGAATAVSQRDDSRWFTAY